MIRRFQTLPALWALLLIPVLPCASRADPAKDVPVVVYEPDCVGWKCLRTFRVAVVDRVTSSIASGGRFKPIDRANLHKVMKAQLSCRKAIRLGLSSRECRIEVGRVMQARKMVSTRLVKMGRSFQVSVSLTDLSTMKTEHSASLPCRRCDNFALLDMLDRAVGKMLGRPDKPGHLRVEGTPAGARVTVTGPPAFKGPASATLPWTWLRVPVGTYHVKVQARDHQPHAAQVQVLPDKTRVVTVGLVSTLKPARPDKPDRPDRPVSGGGKMTWVPIPGGVFPMGSSSGAGDEKPRHRVAVKYFQMSKTEVTVQQYRACVSAGSCSKPLTGTACNWGKQERDNHPVNCVNWSQARAFCRWAGGKLPSEAQWEYAARGGGRNVPYPWGREPATCARAVMSSGGNGCGKNRTWPVCSNAAGNTSHGLCDMAGNVLEWVEDRWHNNYRRAPSSGGAWTAGSSPRRVCRGGSWNDGARGLRVTYRLNESPSLQGVYIGFRCVKAGR